MTYINKWFIIIWMVLILLSGILTFNCSVGEYIDDEKMVELCGVRGNEYFKIRQTDTSFCPEGQQAVKSAGTCFPDLSMIIFFSVIYNVIYLIVFLVIRKKSKVSKNGKSKNKN